MDERKDEWPLLVGVEPGPGDPAQEVVEEEGQQEAAPIHRVSVGAGRRVAVRLPAVGVRPALALELETNIREDHKRIRQGSWLKVPTIAFTSKI